MLPLISTFIDEKLLDDSFIVFNETEAKLLEESYSNILQIIVRDLEKSLEEYEIYFRVIMRYFEQLEKDAFKVLGELDIDLNKIKFSAKQTGGIGVATIVSSALLATIGREAAVQIFGGILLTGGTVGVAVAIWTLFDGIKKYKEYKNSKTNNVKWTKIFNFAKKNQSKKTSEKEKE
jgi:hypothetical protein